MHEFLHVEIIWDFDGNDAGHLTRGQISDDGMERYFREREGCFDVSTIRGASPRRVDEQGIHMEIGIR